MSCDLLELRDVSIGFWRGRRGELVLDRVSMDVRAGELVAVVGQRWEGKSTLLRLAAGMLLAHEGHVRFEGVDLAEIPGRRRARLLGREIVWLDRQDADLGLRVLDCVGLPMAMGRARGRAQVRRMAADALERVGVGHVAHSRPPELSSWERVLVGVASAILASPKLVVVDDLFDALGVRRTQQLGDLLRSLAHDSAFAVLFGVSDIEAAVMAHRVMAFEQRTLRVMSQQPQDHTDELSLARAGRSARGRSPSTSAC